MLLGKRLFPIFLAVVISATLTVLVTVNKMRDAATADSINALLYDLNSELDILIHLKKNYPSDSFVRKKVEGLVVGKLLAMSTAKPDLTKLQGVPLDALYGTLKYLKDYDWDSKEGKEAFAVVRPYVNEIEESSEIANEEFNRFRTSVNNHLNHI